MAVAVSRRSLFARLRGGPAQLRPPWALAEDEFSERCTQCSKCLEACPTGLIKAGHAGYPIVDFSDADCTFCGACRDACGDGCFDREAERGWRLKSAISQACIETKGVSCRVCQDACDVGAIRFRPQLGGRFTPEISFDDCTGCGACVAPCPVSAITIYEPEHLYAEVSS